MGIKGIYAELGPGRRVSLAKLATEKLERDGRPLRIAIDISIWQFQVLAARGGANPAIRTLFYRLSRLLGLSIEPIFVFDGPRKPAFKRNKRSARGEGTATALAKRLITLFGFRVHDAPGEAEAECALLQRHGIVDAVLSEDVDTIMFGCTKTLRNWTSEGTRSSKTPTHVTEYDVAAIRSGNSGLNREGMVLVALMSGGDYIPEGIPGCGPKVACEAARAGFGRSLCKLKRSDEAGLQKWKQDLVHELRTNENGFFRTKHKALAIPDSFPSMEVLRYYTHPVVSDAATIENLGKVAEWTRPVNVPALRGFADEIFDWNFRIGAEKYIRVLAPSLLVQKLMSSRKTERESAGREGAALLEKITGRREHFSTDGTPELRIVYVPSAVVGLDLSTEPEEVVSYGREGLALNSDDEFGPNEAEGEECGAAASKSRFDVDRPDAIWVPETIVKLGAPLLVEDWEEARRAKQAKAAKARPRTKSKAKAPVATGGAKASGPLDAWAKLPDGAATKPSKSTTSVMPISSLGLQDTLLGKSAPNPRQTSIQSTAQSPAKTKTARVTASASDPSKHSARLREPRAHANPWTYSGSQVTPRITKVSSGTPARVAKDHDTILISSSPAGAPSPPRRAETPRQHAPDPRSLPAELYEDSPVPQTPSSVGRREIPPLSGKSDPRQRRRAVPESPGKTLQLKLDHFLSSSPPLISQHTRSPNTRKQPGSTSPRRTHAPVLTTDTPSRKSHLDIAPIHYASLIGSSSFVDPLSDAFDEDDWEDLTRMTQLKPQSKDRSRVSIIDLTGDD